MHVNARDSRGRMYNLRCFRWSPVLIPSDFPDTTQEARPNNRMAGTDRGVKRKDEVGVTTTTTKLKLFQT